MLASVLYFLLVGTQAARIVQSNDDGWAEKNIRVLYSALVAAGNNVILSGPAENQSGRGSSDSGPKPRKRPCQYHSCPANGPAVGADPEEPRFEHVNSYPVTAIKNGITNLAPRIFGGNGPELAVTGVNVGSNLDVQVPWSGTVGAAVEAVKRGIPAIAFSGLSGRPTAYNTDTPLHSQIYADLATNITMRIIDSGKPYLPEGVWLNVNFPHIRKGRCNDVAEFHFVLSRIHDGDFSDKDTETCGRGCLPREREVVHAGCFISVSPGDANDKTTVDAARQAIVARKLEGLLACLP